MPFLNALDDDLEVFDHVPYRFDSKDSFIEFLCPGYVVRGAHPTS